MLREVITDSRPATECDRCEAEYREKNGCIPEKTGTEVMACQVEHNSWQQKVMDRFMRRM